MKSHFYIACGKSIPTHTPHAVSVSLPTIADVLAYKENKNGWSNSIFSGYPRFYTHPYEQMASAFIRKILTIGGDQNILLMPSRRCAEHVVHFAKEDHPIRYFDGLTFITIPYNHPNLVSILSFIRRTGCKAYSRQIEDFLIRQKLLEQQFHEDIVETNPDGSIKTTLSRLYNIDQDQIFLYSSGMNALYSTFTAFKTQGDQTQRQLFIQFGQIYFGTAEILKEYSKEYLCIESVYDLNTLERILNEKGSKVAAIFTEVPTNPFLEICDLPQLKKIASRYNIPLVVDVSLGPHINLNVLPFCDVAVESLTKFASGSGEVMGGAAILSQSSIFYNNLSALLPQWGEPFYLRDAQRLAYTIKGYLLRVSWARESVRELVAFFSNHPNVKKVRWSHSTENIDNYRKIECSDGCYSPIVSVEFEFPLEKVYDKLLLPKGPSMGTDFTLVMPYFYIANYKLMRSEEGKQALYSKGINPEMLRISIGCEPTQQIIGIFANALNV